MSTSDSTTAKRSTGSPDETSKLPAYEEKSSGARGGTSGADGSATGSKGSSRTAATGSKGSASGDAGREGSSRMGSGKGSASKGASRSPVRSSSGTAAVPAERRGPRRVRLTLARLDPFSVMKLSFLVAIAIGIATVVAVAVLWNVVDAIGLWTKIDQLGRDMNSGKPLPFMELFQFRKMVSYGVVVAVVNIVIITALGTLLAFLYNIVAALLGGLRITFTDE